MTDAQKNIQSYILDQFRQSALDQKNHRWLQSHGLTPDMIENLCHLTLDAEQVLIRSNPFKITVSQSLLSMHLSGLADKQERDALATRALQLGASRRMLSDLLSISDSEYKRLKGVAKLPSQQRSRPRAISMDVLDELANLHTNIVRSNQRQGIDPHPLQILISISEATDIELNQLYESYYRPNRELFLVKNRREGADAI